MYTENGGVWNYLERSRPPNIPCCGRHIILLAVPRRNSPPRTLPQRAPVFSPSTTRKRAKKSAALSFFATFAVSSCLTGGTLFDRPHLLLSPAIRQGAGSSLSARSSQIMTHIFKPVSCVAITYRSEFGWLQDLEDAAPDITREMEALARAGGGGRSYKGGTGEMSTVYDATQGWGTMRLRYMGRWVDIVRARCVRKFDCIARLQ